MKNENECLSHCAQLKPAAGQMAIEMMSVCSASTLLVTSVGSDTRMETPKRQQYARTMLDGVMMINGLVRNV